MLYKFGRWMGLLGLLAAVVSVSAQQAAAPFYLTFIPNIQFAPLYVAIQNGYFQEAGQPIREEYVNEPDAIDLVAVGQANFAIVSAEQVILAGANGRPITYVYNWFDDYPIAIVASADAGIETIRDLVGRRVGVPIRSGANYTGLTALLRAEGLSESDIDLQEIGFNAPEAFCTGRVEASAVYINNEPLQIQRLIEAGQCSVSEIRLFPVSEVLPLVSNGLIVNNDFLNRNPDLVAQFVEAYHRGLQEVINNPARAYLLSLAHVENLPMNDDLRAVLEQEAAEQDAFLAAQPDREAIAASREALRERLHAQFDRSLLLQMDVLLNTIELWDSDPLGMTEADAWSNMVDVLQELGKLPARATGLDALFTNQFVPESDRALDR
ncbi:ABC transporter substrate-binding protein [Aggregatilineales bacterium SYSU G02658]